MCGPDSLPFIHSMIRHSYAAAVQSSGLAPLPADRRYRLPFTIGVIESGGPLTRSSRQQQQQSFVTLKKRGGVGGNYSRRKKGTQEMVNKKNKFNLIVRGKLPVALLRVCQYPCRLLFSLPGNRTLKMKQET